MDFQKHKIFSCFFENIKKQHNNNTTFKKSLFLICHLQLKVPLPSVSERQMQHYQWET